MPVLGPHNLTEMDGELALQWQPSKAGSREVSVLVAEMLRMELDIQNGVRDTFLVTERGNPFASSGSLDNRIRKWVEQAGITDAQGKANRSQHGIRKGVAQLLANEGASEYEIMTTLGHSDPRTARIYTDKADRAGMGVSASRKRT